MIVPALIVGGLCAGVAGLILGYSAGLERGKRSQAPSWAELRALQCYAAGKERGRREVIEELLRRRGAAVPMVRVDGPAQLRRIDP